MEDFLAVIAVLAALLGTIGESRKPAKDGKATGKLTWVGYCAIVLACVACVASIAHNHVTQRDYSLHARLAAVLLEKVEDQVRDAYYFVHVHQELDGLPSAKKDLTSSLHSASDQISFLLEAYRGLYPVKTEAIANEIRTRLQNQIEFFAEKDTEIDSANWLDSELTEMTTPLQSELDVGGRRYEAKTPPLKDFVLDDANPGPDPSLQ